MRHLPAAFSLCSIPGAQVGALLCSHLPLIFRSKDLEGDCPVGYAPCCYLWWPEVGFGNLWGPPPCGHCCVCPLELLCGVAGERQDFTSLEQVRNLDWGYVLFPEVICTVLSALPCLTKLLLLF